MLEKTNEELSNSLYAFGLLGLHPGHDFLQAWKKAAEEKIGNFNSQELSNSLYAFALLDKFVPLFLIDPLTKVTEGTEFSRESLCAIYLVQQYLATRKGTLNLSQPLRKKIKDILLDMKKEQDQRSSLEEEVEKHLKRMELPYKPSSWIEAVGSHVDFADPTTKKWILEVDGPTHFLSNGKQRPQDLLKDRILKHNGWCVVRIPYNEWNQENDKEGYLNKKLGMDQATPTTS